MGLFWQNASNRLLIEESENPVEKSEKIGLISRSLFMYIGLFWQNASDRLPTHPLSTLLKSQRR